MNLGWRFCIMAAVIGAGKQIMLVIVSRRISFSPTERCF